MRRRRHDNPLSLFSFQDIITSVTGILILLAILLAIAVIRQADASPIVAEGPATEALAHQVAALESELDQLRQIVREAEARLATWSGRTTAELQAELASLQATRTQEDSTRQAADRSAAEVRQRLRELQNDPQVADLKQRVADAQQQLATLQAELNKLRSGSQVVYNFRATSSQPWLVEISRQGIRVGRAQERAAPQEFASASQFDAFAQRLPSADRYFVLIVKPSGIASHQQVRTSLESMGAEIGTELIGEDQTALDPQTGAVHP